MRWVTDSLEFDDVASMGYNDVGMDTREADPVLLPESPMENASNRWNFNDLQRSSPGKALLWQRSVAPD